MNCNSSRKYFYAFLDDELDVERNIEVLAHLDVCCECSQRMEKERRLQTRIRETVCEVKAPACLEQMILERMEEKQKPNALILFLKNFTSGLRLVPVAGIVAAVIMTVYFFVSTGSLKKDDALYLAESKYHDYLMRQLDLDIRSQDPKTVVEYLQKQTNASVVLPAVSDDAWLIGAAVYEIDGAAVSQVFYMQDETPVSFMIICGPDSLSGYRKGIDFSGMEERHFDGKAVYYKTGYCGHCQIMGWKEAGYQYVMVSGTHSEDMMKILRKA